MPDISIQIALEPHADGLPLPEYESEHAAGLDLRAAIPEAITLMPGERRLIPTGVRVALPHGTEGQVRPRSGLALRHGLSLVNTPGTIDADYRGEIRVILINLGGEPYVIERGDRIAQLVISPVLHVELTQVAHLTETERGQGGFGHTGR